MTPIYLDGRFGWLHDAAADRAAGGLGVVLCPAFAQEEVCTHHGLVLFAQALAARGLPTIRFDYAGTGDSVDAEPTLTGLVADVERAAATLRAECGVGRVVLAGVRLGAAVAIEAASAIPDVAALALLAPVLSGSAFMRETRASAAVASLSGLDPVPPLGDDRSLNTNGFHWSGAFQREVAEIDLATAPPAAAHALFATARADRRSAKLAARWADEGASVTELPFADYDGWMQDPTTNQPPAETFAAVVDWIAALPAGEPVAPASAVLAPAPTLASTLSVADWIEEPVAYGMDDALVGILCRPAGRAAAPVAALLMHEGSTHHIGNGRAYVRLARALAAAGFASLRMDLTGMGDSLAGDDPRHPHYDPERIPQGFASLDLLETRGFPRAVVLGLCSGAHTALQVTLGDRRAVGAVVLNLQKFIWHYGDDIRIATRDNKRSLKGYLRAMRNPGEWRRAFRGDADLGGIARVLAKRGLARTRHAVLGLFPPQPGSEAAQVRGQMRALADRRAHVHLVFSDEDPGLAEMWMQFGRGARRMAQYAPVRMTMLGEADHHFNGTSARRRHVDLVVEALSAIADEYRADAPRVATDAEEPIGNPA